MSDGPEVKVGPRAGHGGVFPAGLLPAVGGVTHLVVLTAAMSSLNSGLYATCRVLRSMAKAGSVPRFTGAMSRHRVPYGGILLMVGLCVLGVGLNAVVPNFAALGILATWCLIMICHLAFRRRTRTGELTRPGCRLPFAPYTQVVTLAFLVAVLLLMAADGEGPGRVTVLCPPLTAAALVAGWFGVRGQVAAVREGSMS